MVDSDEIGHTGNHSRRRTATTQLQSEDPSLDEGLRLAVQQFGCDPLTDPDRTVAITADLVGSPGRSLGTAIQGLRVALYQLDQHRNGLVVNRTAWEASIDAEGVELDDRRLVVSTCMAVLPLDEPEPSTSRDPEKGTGLSTAALLAVVAATMALVLAIVFSRPPPEPEDEAVEDNSSTSTVSPDDEGGDPNLPPDAGIVAQFAPVEEGPVTVTRGWRVTPGGLELVGIVYITNPGDQVLTISHRELPPPLAVTDPGTLEWTPDPNGLVNTTAVYQLALEPGETLEVSFRSLLDPELRPTEATVVDWFENWKPSAESIRSRLGNVEPLLGPEIKVES